MKKIKTVSLLVAFVAGLAVFLTNIDNIYKFFRSYFYRNDIGINYVRLYGAIEVPTLIDLITTGGLKKNKLGLYVKAKNGANLVGELGPFWFEKFDYKDSLPLFNKLWEKCLDQNFDVKLLGMASNDPERDITCVLLNKEFQGYKCDRFGHVDFSEMYKDLSDFLKNKSSSIGCKYIEDADMYEYNEKMYQRQCNFNNVYKVGFLFIIIENLSNEVLHNLKISYKEFSKDDLPASILDKLEHSGIERLVDIKNDAIITKEYPKLIQRATVVKIVPQLKPHKSLLWLLSIYKARDDDKLEDKFLTDLQFPLHVAYTVDGHSASMNIRLPLRNKAARIIIPHGWYKQ